MTRPIATAVVAHLRKNAKHAIANMPKVPNVISPSEQQRRFIEGAERWRLEQGLISPTEWHEYEKTMLKQLGLVQSDQQK